MSFCPECGTNLGEVATVADAAAEVDSAEVYSSAEVEIARINADKEIRLAKIAAGAIEVEAQVAVVEAEARADAAESVAEALTPEPLEAAPTVVINDPGTSEPEGSETDLPAAGEHDSPDDDKPKKRSGYGNPLFFS